MKTRASFLIAIVWAALMQSYATTSAVPQPESPDTTAGPVSIQTGDASQHSAAEGTTHQTNGVKDLPRRHNKLSKAKHLPLPSHVRAFKTSTPINPRQSGAVKSGIDGKRVETGTANKAIPVRSPRISRTAALTGTGLRHLKPNQAIVSRMARSKTATSGALNGSEMGRRR